MTNAMTELVESQEWVKPVEEGLQSAVSGAYSAAGEPGRMIENALHGTWLGHPLHPALTDVPIGAWTTAAALDAVDAISGKPRYAAGAEGAIAVGLVGAVGSAVTGLTDWHKTDGSARRIGLLHGVLNLGATALFTASWLLRRGGNRETGQICSAAGFLVAMGSAYLGGKLVYDERIGTDHADRKPLPDGFVPVLPESELQESTPRRVEVDGLGILLVRYGERVHAIGEVCSHLGGPLAEGNLEGGGIRCPWHGSRFSVEDGRVLDGPATIPQPCFQARIREGQIEVRGPSIPR